MIASTNIVWPNVAMVAKQLGHPIAESNYASYREFIKQNFVDPDLIITFTTVLKATQYEVINWPNYIGVQYNREAEIALLHGSLKQWYSFIEYILSSHNPSHNVYRQVMNFLLELKTLRLVNLELDKDGRVVKWSVT
jgi:hypothetical protein